MYCDSVSYGKGLPLKNRDVDACVQEALFLWLRKKIPQNSVSKEMLRV